jgi:hypothetical protein
MANPWQRSGGSASTKDSWYRELSIRFADGTEEHFYIELTQTGTHIPRILGKPADWTLLRHLQCKSCPLDATRTRYCPAAESLETTLMRLQNHFSHEVVKGRAVDGASRETLIERPLQEVGTALVQLAVFSSGCPVGKEFRPMLSDLRPFSTNEELTRHLVTKMVLKHRGRMADSRQDIVAKLAPLREVFAQLCRRLPVDSKGDAMANSIISVDAATLSIAMGIDEALNELAAEMGWEVVELPPAPLPASARPAPPPPPRRAWWRRLLALFDRR